MTESGGLGNDPAYRRYRVSSSRWFVTGDCLVARRYRVGILLGVADLTLHASEGETRKFDGTFLGGLSLDTLVAELPGLPMSVLASLEYLTFEPDKERVLYVRKRPSADTYRSWDTLSLEWQELAITLRTVLELDAARRLHVGVRYVEQLAEQQGHFDGAAYSGDFKPKTPVGMFTALELDLPHDLELHLQADFIDETAVRIGLMRRF